MERLEFIPRSPAEGDPDPTPGGGADLPIDVRDPEQAATDLQVESPSASFTEEAVPQMDILYNFALRLTRHPDDASDLLQETYLKAFRNWHQYRRGSNIRAWLFQIMKNSFINLYRKRVKRPPTIDYNEIEGHSLPAGHPPQEIDEPILGIFPCLLDDDVERALDALPEEFRTAIVLCDLEGFQYCDIAEILRCPLGTVRSRIHRGRSLLRAMLLRYARDHGLLQPD